MRAAPVKPPDDTSALAQSNRVVAFIPSALSSRAGVSAALSGVAHPSLAVWGGANVASAEGPACLGLACGCVRPACNGLPLRLRRVEGFPTIKAFVGGRMVDYQGDRSARGLTNWAILLIPNRVAQLPPSGDKLEAFLQRCGGGEAGGGGAKGKKVGKDGASWGGCVLLFSDKKATSPLYKSLAAQHAGKLAFGEVRARCGPFALYHPVSAGCLPGVPQLFGFLMDSMYGQMQLWM